MKAMTWTAYGDPNVLKLAEIDQPKIKPNQVFVNIKKATVTAGDCELRSFSIAWWLWLPLRFYMGIFKPRIKVLGQEYAGTVTAVGNQVNNFSVNDQIFASGGVAMGAYSQFTALNSEKAIGRIPCGVSFDEAATIPTGGINALHFLRKAKIRNGSKVLINGAGGSIGTYAVQLAKLYGAETTCVDSSEKLDLLLELGADHVIDYRKTDFTKSNETYDAIIDIVGNSSFSRCMRCLNDNGYYVLGNPGMMGVIKGLFNETLGGFKRKQKHVVFEMADENIEDYDYLVKLIKNKELRVVIDKHYPLEKLAEAHKYVDQGLKKGNVIIDID